VTNALDLFAGPGGWSVACHQLGINEVGIDNDPDAVRTARAAGHRRELADVRRYMPRPFDGLIASPPCQTFSAAGNGNGVRALDRILAAVPMVARGVTPADAMGAPDYTPDWATLDALFAMPEGLDPRSALVLEPLRYVLAEPPTWIALEQVPSVLPVWAAYADALRAWGYKVATGILSAECYGVPQVRRRAVLLAHRNHRVHLPAATHSRYYPNDPTRRDRNVDPWVSMADALGWGMTRRPYPTVATGTAAGGTDPQALGGSGARAIIRRELDAERWVMRGPGFVGDSGNRDVDHPAPTLTSKATAVWVRDQSRTPRDPSWPTKRPATTVAGRDTITDPGANANRFNGSTKSRNDGVRVSVAEAGILQGFPPDYPWSGNRTSQYQQVGDAIPPPMARAILAELAR
jgi:DNA (cytosine-5)-methyltransferase 1